MNATERPSWAANLVLPEAVGMANRVASDFRISLDTAARHAPNPKDAQCRSVVLNEFLNVLPDVVAKLVCDFGGDAPEMEAIFHQITAVRFETSRREKNAATLKNNSKPTIVRP